jgi:DNA polymerase-3 subunit epsilon
MERETKKICFIDIETTGLDPSKHEIVELAALVVDPTDWQIIRELELRVKPEHIETASKEALKINGWFPSDDAVSLDWGLSELEPLLCDAIPAGHNPRFDLGFLEAAWRKLHRETSRQYRPQGMDYHILDTVALCMPLYLTGELTSLKLAAVCAHLGIPTPTHRAMADCRASLEVARRIIGHGGSRHQPESSPYGDPGAPDTIDGVPLNIAKSISITLLKGQMMVVENLEMIYRYQLGEGWARFRDASGREEAFPTETILRVSATPHRSES